MEPTAVGIFILTGITVLGFGFGYIFGMEHPSKGEIILWVDGPHKCKGMPKRGGWHEGTQWKCNTCDDVWELKGTYDGIERGSEWKRITVKGKKATTVKNKLDK